MPRATNVVLRGPRTVRFPVLSAAPAAKMASVASIPHSSRPNGLVVLPIIVVATLYMGSAILDTSSLGFLGLGVQPPTPEWGTMLSEGREFMRVAPWLMFFPGLAISVATLGMNLLGDGLRDVLDPRLARGG